ncbi:MAG TPA: hypothetical protein VIU65_08795 [Pyrinomonadaceae bacterium]
MKRLVLVLAFLLCAASFSFADTIYLRDGRTIRGTLLGFINGRFVVRIDTRYSTLPGSNTDTNVARNRQYEEIQYFRPNEVDRIEIDNRSLDEARYESRTVQVGLDPNWIDSGVELRRGERVQVSATGVINVGRTRITPDGLRSTDPSAPLPNAAEGELIGSVGDDPSSPIIELGSNRDFTAASDGRLYLTANRGSFADARGTFSVNIRRERDLNTVDDDTGFNRPGRIRSRNRQGGGGYGRPGNREQVIDVPGTSRGTDTGIDVRAGDQITFTATGVVVAGQRAGSVGPEGGRSTGFGSIVGTRPVPGSGVGALIGYIRTVDGQNSQPFFIGSQLTFSVTVDGRLYLAINDDNYNDNSGSFNVRIRY